MNSKIIIQIVLMILCINFPGFAAQTSETIALSDPKINKIRQFGDSIWAVGRGITIFDLRTQQLHKLHQEDINLASADLLFYDIFQNDDGSFYLASDKGIWILKDNRFSIINKSNSPLPSDTIKSIGLGNDGMIWIGTDKGAYKEKR